MKLQLFLSEDLLAKRQRVVRMTLRMLWIMATGELRLRRRFGLP